MSPTFCAIYFINCIDKNYSAYLLYLTKNHTDNTLLNEPHITALKGKFYCKPDKLEFISYTNKEGGIDLMANSKFSFANFFTKNLNNTEYK